jgi:CheY-like chemotaxis protein
MPDRPFRILLVEDHDVTRIALSIWLADLGYQVVAAESATAALRAVENTEFDLLVSDVHLPDGSGLDLVKRVRERKVFPAIAISGVIGRNERDLAKAAGFSELLEKPLERAGFVEKIKALIK